MRQQYLAPRQSVTFLGFAERLTAGWRDGEQPAQVDKLLLHAFLEDLRQAYRRRVWRPGDWRRTAYPVLLLDGVTVDGVGHTLARLLNDVRNETGRNDPLLVVALATAPPPELPGTRPLREADDACDEWAEALPETRRLRRAAAWLVTLRPDDDDVTPPPGLAPPALVAPDPPWWARRFLPAAVVLALLVGAGAWADSRWTLDCHPALTGQVRVQLIAGECVGYSDGAAQVFNSEPGQDRLRAVQRRIFAQNRAAEEVWQRSDRRRPLSHPGLPGHPHRQPDPGGRGVVRLRTGGVGGPGHRPVRPAQGVRGGRRRGPAARGGRQRGPADAPRRAGGADAGGAGP